MVLLKGGVDNLFHALADEQIAAAETRIKQCEALIEVADAARRLVDAYESIEEEPAPMSSQPSMGFLGFMDSTTRWRQA
ncbi:hypothetical protein D3C87_1613000 [compost metagenome]